MFYEIQWMTQGMFYLFISTSFISVFYFGLDVLNKYFEIILIILPIISLIINIGIFERMRQSFDDMIRRDFKWFLYLNFLWGFLGFLQPIWRLVENDKNIEFEVIDNWRYSLRMVHMILFIFYLGCMYDKRPLNQNSKKDLVYRLNMVLNIVTFCYYTLSEFVSQIKKKSFSQNVSIECKNYTKSVQFFCNGKYFYETFFYSFSILSIFFIWALLKTSKYWNEPSSIKDIPNFYCTRNREKISRKWTSSIVGMIISIIIIICTICCFFILDSKKDIIYYNNLNTVIYIFGILACVVFSFEMKTFPFLNETLSQIDQMILEFGTIGQLFYLVSMFIISISATFNVSSVVHYSSVFMFLFNILQVCCQRIVQVAALKISYSGVIKDSDSILINQICPCMILMVLNLCMVPTIFYLNRVTESIEIAKDSEPHLWSIFANGRGPVLALHRLHGCIVFGYTLYQTW